MMLELCWQLGYQGCIINNMTIMDEIMILRYWEKRFIIGRYH